MVAYLDDLSLDAEMTEISELSRPEELRRRLETKLDNQCKKRIVWTAASWSCKKVESKIKDKETEGEETKSGEDIEDEDIDDEETESEDMGLVDEGK